MRRLRRYVTWIVDHAWLTIAVVALITGFFCYQLTRLVFTMEPEANYPQDHPYVRIDREIRERFGGARVVLVALIARRGTVWTPRMLAKVHALTRDVLNLEGVVPQNVVSLASPNVRYIDQSSGGLEVKYIMREPPRSDADVARVRRILESIPLYRGTLVSPDGKAALLIADFWPERTSTQIYEALEKVVAPYRDADTDIAITGRPILTHFGKEYVAELRVKMVLAFFVIMGVLYLAFASLQGMLVPMLTALLSTVWCMGTVGAVNMPVDNWNNFVPILVMAIAAGHSAQILKRYYEEIAAGAENRAAVIESTTRMGAVMIAAGTTATLGFSALAFSHTSGVRHFGLSTAFGIVSAMILEMTFIPALRSLMPRPASTPHGRAAALLGRALGGLSEVVIGPKRWTIFAAFGLVVGLSVAAFPRVHTGSTIMDYIAKGSLGRTYLEKIRRHFPGTTTLTILFEGRPGMAKEPAVLTTMAGLQRALAEDPAVERTVSVADLIAYAYHVFAPERANGQTLPRDRRLVAQLFFLTQSAAFERFVDRSYSHALVWAYLNRDESLVVARVIARARDYMRAHPLDGRGRVEIAGGAGPTFLAFDEDTTRGKIRNVVVIMTVIYAIASLLLRAPLAGLYVISPLVVTALASFGILGWASIRLEHASASIIAISVGIGADYAIYFLYRLREEYVRVGDAEAALGTAMDTSGRAVITVALAISAGYASLAPTGFIPFRIFGTMVPATMLLSCLTAISLMPALALASRPKFLFGQRQADADERRRGEAA